MNTPMPRTRIVAVALLTLAALVLGACGGSDSAGDEGSTFCTSVDSLKKSVTGLTEIPIDQGALTTLQDRFAQIQSDLSDVKADAGDEFATEIDDVDQAASDLGSRLDEAVATPSLQTASAVGTSAKALGSSLKALTDAVKSTC